MRGNILVVDDEAGPREALRMILKPNHDVRTASSGPEALTLIAEQQPDLIFLDLRMPGMDGTQVLKAVRSQYADIQVAIVTAYAGIESARLAVRYGAIEYLTKPYSVAEVEDIVGKALAVRRQGHDEQVLRAQLTKLTESATGAPLAIDVEDPQAVAEAVDRLESMQTSLSQDIRRVRELYDLGEVTAEVTHDISNFLTIILSNSQFLLRQLDLQSDPRDAGVSERVLKITRAAEDCSEMIARIKDFVRLSGGRPMQPLSINELVASVVNLKRGASPDERARVRYVMDLGPVPQIQGDEVALRTVLVNLIDNGLDAMGHEGRIEVATESDGEHVVVRITDDGCGMSAEVLEHAKDPYFSSGKDHGTGIGLRAADKVVLRHHGKLLIESELGVGTTVTIELPIEPPSGAPIEDESPAEYQPDTVVIAEDEPGMRELLSRSLGAQGYRVLTAPDGAIAWQVIEAELAQAGSGALIALVTDQVMPGMSGRELAQKVKTAAPTIPVVIVTGYAPPAGEAPEDVLLQKPFALQELLDSVEGLLATVRA